MEPQLGLYAGSPDGQPLMTYSTKYPQRGSSEGMKKLGREG